jgi:4-hydroxybenzoate polyprenyltransferase
MAGWLKSTTATLEMIKWEHSIFALPFALSGAVLAAHGLPKLATLGWIILCMVSARSAAMAFNRLVDADFDRANPRTANRAIPAGALSRSFVAVFVLLACAVFVFGTFMLNHLTLVLSPVALVIVLGYSYMKRLTSWSHLVLGLALGIAPSAAWIAVRGTYDARMLVLTALVLLWVGGFDVLYACQDFEHDCKVGLHSVPAAFGMVGAFRIARAMHIEVVVLAFWLDLLFALGPTGYAGTALVAALLLYEHLIISPTDIRRMDAAFFLLNGIISVVFFVFVAAAVFAGRHLAL